ncbi:hypothetical protein GBP13_08650 [Pediococcus acidilactici]|uniref:hypothetical protein n=1 Tax=Pediococcus acidilactici TaxID=1254 RepID=UPI001324939B|nr:hypothetical protein [Pediococcus acidilactici]KAF0362548.1 hypothetical protein GBO50_08645 [Pediococcus acidilactici]KAF0368134.1 hypothetical protein GBO55_03195 [Pediococcus acidilactici]KAF0417252.1 hypothetical protein GBO80_08645 [Pediococcus acidilactici]KAF0420679.1 hypothetical protein GBO82_08640 [Pediococcus acidilactici]KAF0472821.1 hypothetical protein GBP08_08650 [Pediococcus acidilactici]
MNKPQLEKWQRLDKAFPNKPKIDDKTVDRLVKAMRDEFFKPEYGLEYTTIKNGFKKVIISACCGIKKESAEKQQEENP